MNEKLDTHHPITLLRQVTSQPNVHVSELSEEPGEHGEHTRAQAVAEPRALAKMVPNTAPLCHSGLHFCGL